MTVDAVNAVLGITARMKAGDSAALQSVPSGARLPRLDEREHVAERHWISLDTLISGSTIQPPMTPIHCSEGRLNSERFHEVDLTAVDKHARVAVGRVCR